MVTRLDAVDRIAEDPVSNVLKWILLVGAIDRMILAVMTRVARGVTCGDHAHRGRSSGVGQCRSSSSQHVFGFPLSEVSRCVTGRCCSFRAKLTSDTRPITRRCV